MRRLAESLPNTKQEGEYRSSIAKENQEFRQRAVGIGSLDPQRPAESELATWGSYQQPQLKVRFLQHDFPRPDNELPQHRGWNVQLSPSKLHLRLEQSCSRKRQYGRPKNSPMGTLSRPYHFRKALWGDKSCDQHHVYGQNIAPHFP